MDLIVVLLGSVVVFFIGVIAGAKSNESTFMERYRKYPERFDPDYQDWKAKKDKRE